MSFKYGYLTRKHGEDGLENWKRLKPAFTTNNTISHWKPHTKHFYPAMVEFFNLIEDKSKTDKKTWERHHFFIQLGRIPSTKPATLECLLQIAYNAGQMKAELDEQERVQRMQAFRHNNRSPDFVANQVNGILQVDLSLKLDYSYYSQEIVQNFHENYLSDLSTYMEPHNTKLFKVSNSIVNSTLSFLATQNFEN
jgi:hypothetical protein